MAKKSSRRNIRQAPFSERFGAWLLQRRRLVRSLLAGILAVVMTGSIGVLFYGYLISLPVGSLNIGTAQAQDFIAAFIIGLAVLGVVLYAIGWRLFIGFGGNDAFRPGRAAVVWIILGVSIFAATAIVMVFYTAVALSQQ